MGLLSKILSGVLVASVIAGAWQTYQLQRCKTARTEIQGRFNLAENNLGACELSLIVTESLIERTAEIQRAGLDSLVAAENDEADRRQWTALQHQRAFEERIARLVSLRNSILDHPLMDTSAAGPIAYLREQGRFIGNQAGVQ